MDNDNKWKEDLLGRVYHEKERDKKPIPNGWLEIPFESEGAVAYAYCCECGLLYELKPDEASALFSKLGMPYELKDRHYFELDGCGTCTRGKGEIKYLPFPQT